MISKIFKKIKEHKLIAGIIFVVILGGAYLSFKGTNAESALQYTTGAVEKGTIVSSVSGSGQINVSEQMEIKPEVSGKITKVYVTKGQEVKKGNLLVSIDSRDAERTVSDAKIALETAKADLAELQKGTNALSLTKAENALAEAERNLEKAQTTYDNIGNDSEDTLKESYNDGYSNVSTSFFKLSGYMEDLQDVLGTDSSEQEHVSDYKNILGDNSPFIEKLLSDYKETKNLYDENFTFFRGVSTNDNRDTTYKLIKDTLETTKKVAQTLESARHMYDNIATVNYTKYSIASTIDTMQPKIENDLSSVYSTITSLENTLKTIDTTIEDTPGKIEDAKISLASAKENVESKKSDLEDIQAGVASLDIRTQQNVVAQKQRNLVDAGEKLAAHFVRAPFNGTISEMDLNNGDSVSSGTALATLITKLQIAELSLNEIDIAKVKLNQSATLSFDAIEGLTLTGKVIDVDSIATTNQGVVTYGVTIALDMISDQVKPGMTTDVSIITDTKNDVLYVQNAAIKTQDDGSYSVEVLDDTTNKTSTKKVETGVSNDEVTEITSGLQEGDKVVTATSGGTTSKTTTTTKTSAKTSSVIPGLGGGGNSGFRGPQ